MNLRQLYFKLKLKYLYVKTNKNKKNNLIIYQRTKLHSPQHVDIPPIQTLILTISFVHIFIKILNT